MDEGKAEEVEKNMADIQGLIQGYREMADTDYSFALDGNQVVKIHHNGTPANEIAARIGTTEDRVLLQKFESSIERHEEPKPQKQEETEPATEDLGLKEYEKYVERQNAEAAEKIHGLAPTVSPGMFGAANG